MSSRTSEIETTPAKDPATLESAVRGMWERIRRAGEALVTLRQENQVLTQQVDDLQRRLMTAQGELSAKEQELKRLRTEHTQLLSSNGRSSLSEVEKENLKNRIRDLVAKINSHL